MTRSDDELDRLLARGGLGGPAKERIFERVAEAVGARATEAARVAERKPFWRARRFFLTLALAVPAAAALVLVLRPTAPDRDDIRSKGPVSPAAVLDVVCDKATLDRCPVGSTLVFSTLGASTTGYLGAFAEPRTPGGGQRVWYFSADATAPAIPPAREGTVPAPQGIRIGPEHAPGEYRVHVFLSEEPLGQAALLAAAGTDRPPPKLLGHATVDLTVVAP